MYIILNLSGERGNVFLFLPIQMTNQLPASWLRSLIIEAYKDAKLPLPGKSNPHEIRAISVSLALHKNISVCDIVKGCFWTSETVFTTHYLRDLMVNGYRGAEYDWSNCLCTESDVMTFNVYTFKMVAEV